MLCRRKSVQSFRITVIMPYFYLKHINLIIHKYTIKIIMIYCYMKPQIKNIDIIKLLFKFKKYTD